MPNQKYLRLVKEDGNIKQHKERIAAIEGWKRALLSLASANEKINDLKLELMRYRGY